MPVRDDGHASTLQRGEVYFLSYYLRATRVAFFSGSLGNGWVKRMHWSSLEPLLSVSQSSGYAQRGD